jgi:hypothetical protein
MSIDFEDCKICDSSSAVFSSWDSRFGMEIRPHPSVALVNNRAFFWGECKIGLQIKCLNQGSPPCASLQYVPLMEKDRSNFPPALVLWFYLHSIPHRCQSIVRRPSGMGLGVSREGRHRGKIQTRNPSPDAATYSLGIRDILLHPRNHFGIFDFYCSLSRPTSCLPLVYIV